MQRKDTVFFMLFTTLVILALLGGNWGETQAGNTIPTERPPTQVIPTDIPAVLTTPPPKSSSSSSKITSSTPIPAMPRSRYLADSISKIPEEGMGFSNFAGIIPPAAWDKEIGWIQLVAMPANYAPERSQLYFQTEALQIRYYTPSGTYIKNPGLTMTVYYQLSVVTHWYYDNRPERLNLLWYNPTTELWEDTGIAPTLNEEVGKYGALEYPVSETGYYVLGNLAK